MGEEDEKRGKKGGYFFLIIQKKFRWGYRPPLSVYKNREGKTLQKMWGGGKEN